MRSRALLGALGLAALLAGCGGSTTTIIETVSTCHVTEAGGPAKLDLSHSGLSCEEGQFIQKSLKRQANAGFTVGVEVGDWVCSSEPFSEYPILARCRSSTRELDVVGLAPSAHLTKTEIEAQEFEDREPQIKHESEPVLFDTPSRNIGCNVTTQRLLCSIAEFMWLPPSPPADCAEVNARSSWGHTLELNRSGPTFLCTDQAVVGLGNDSDVPVLAYGKTISVGPFSCESRSSALICITRGGHGIILAREKARLF